MARSDATATRTHGEVLGELRALVSLQQDARRQLTDAQRHEWRLVTAIDNRARAIDRVLDELVDLEATCSYSD